jgi:hypothetical protein
METEAEGKRIRVILHGLGSRLASGLRKRISRGKREVKERQAPPALLT